MRPKFLFPIEYGSFATFSKVRGIGCLIVQNLKSSRSTIAFQKVKKVKFEPVPPNEGHLHCLHDREHGQHALHSDSMVGL